MFFQLKSEGYPFKPMVCKFINGTDEYGEDER